MNHVLKRLATLVLLGLVSAGYAATIDTDMVIGPGSPFNGESINVIDGVDGPTTVRIVQGGVVRGFSVGGSSHIVIDGGESTSLSGLGENAILTFLDGGINCSSTECRSFDIDALVRANDNSSIEFRGGVFEPIGIRLANQSTLTVLGEDLALTPFGGDYFVTGRYFDGSTVDIPVRLDADPAGRVFLVPEPSTAIATLLFWVLVASHGCRTHRADR